MSIASITFTNALIEAENIAKSTKLFCLECEKRPTCKKICPELEKELPKERGGGHNREFPTGNIEGVYNYQKEKETGLRKEPKIYGDNWE